MTEPQALPRVFVSHSFYDATYCRAFVFALRAYGFEVWYDEDNLAAGGELRRVIESELQTRDLFVVMLSPAALNSPWVNDEIAAALQLSRAARMRLVLPVIAAPCGIPPALAALKRIEAAPGMPLDPRVAAQLAARALAAPDPVADVLAGRAITSARSRRQLRTQTIITAVTLVAIVLGGLAVYFVPKVINGHLAIDPTAIALSAGGGGWMVGRNGGLAHLSDGQWVAVQSSTHATLNAFAVSGPDDGWAVGDEGALLHCANGTCALTVGPVPTTLYAVAMVSASAGWAAGDRGVILRYAGGLWQQSSGPPGAGALRALGAVSADEVWAGGDGGSVYHYLGGAWSATPLPGALTHVTSISVLGDADVWLAGTRPNAQGSTDSVVERYVGARWTVMETLPAANLESLDMLSDSSGWAAGSGSGGGYEQPLLLGLAHGQWTLAPLPTGVVNTQAALVGVAFAGGDGWAAGSGGIILHDVRGTWTAYQQAD